MSESYFKDNEVTLIISATESTTLHKTGTTYFTFDRNVGKQIVNLKIRGADGVKDVDLNDVEAIKMYYQFTDASAKHLSEEYTVIDANAGKFYFMLNNDRVDYAGEVLIYIYVVMKERTASGEVKSFEAGAIGTTYRESLIDADLDELEALGWDRLDKLEEELRKHVEEIKVEMDRDLKTVKQDLTTAQSDINKIQSQIDDNDIVRQDEFNNLASTGRNLLRDGRTPRLHDNHHALNQCRVDVITENDITFRRCTLIGGTAATAISMWNAFPRSTIVEDLTGKTVELTHKIRANKECRARPLGITLYGDAGTVILPGHSTRPIANLSTDWQTVRHVVTIPKTYNDHTGLRFALEGANDVEIGDWVDFRDWSISIVDDKWSLPIEDLRPTTPPLPLANTPQIGTSGQFADAAHVHQMPTANQVGALPNLGGTLTGLLMTRQLNVTSHNGASGDAQIDIGVAGNFFSRFFVRVSDDRTHFGIFDVNRNNTWLRYRGALERVNFEGVDVAMNKTLSVTGNITAPRLIGVADNLRTHQVTNWDTFDPTSLNLARGQTIGVWSENIATGPWANTVAGTLTRNTGGNHYTLNLFRSSDSNISDVHVRRIRGVSGVWQPWIYSSSANNITSGTINIARIPTGTTGTTVSLGNHTHQNIEGRGIQAAETGTIRPTLVGISTQNNNVQGDYPTAHGQTLTIRGAGDYQMYFEMRTNTGVTENGGVWTRHRRDVGANSWSSYQRFVMEDALIRTWNIRANRADRLSTPRTFTVGNTSKPFDGLTNVTWSLAEIGALATNGNAVSATRLQTPRLINNIAFDGSTNITITANPAHTILPSGTDLNTVLAQGFYGGNSSDWANKPTAQMSWVGLRVEHRNPNPTNASRPSGVQVLTNSDGRQWIRSFSEAVFGQWIEVPSQAGDSVFDMTVTRATSIVTKSGKEVNVSDELTTCQNELQDCKDELTTCQNQLQECKKEIAELKTIMRQLKGGE